MIWDITLSIAAFFAVLIAIRGETWNAKSKSRFRQVTPGGWAALIIGGVILSASIFKSANDNREKSELEKRVADKIGAVGESVEKQSAKIEAEVEQRSRAAANQILSELAPQLTFYKLMLANQSLPNSELLFTVSQFADLFERKLLRYGPQLPAALVDSGEAALSRQKELQLLLTYPGSQKPTDDAVRSQMDKCLSDGKRFGDMLLMQMGYPEGIDNTVIISKP